MVFKKHVYRGLPFANTVLKRFGYERNAVSSAIDVKVCQPAEVEDIPPAVSLPGQLDLVKGVGPSDTLLGQISLAQSTVHHHAPVIRYTLKDCLVAPHGIEFYRGSMRKHSLQPRNFFAGKLTETSDAHYPMSPVSHKYFGHWMTDSCTSSLLAEPHQEILLDINAAWPDAAIYSQAFRLRPASCTPRLVRRLSFYQDHGQGSSKRSRYGELRRRAWESFGTPGDLRDAIYLRRGSTGDARLVADEEQLAASLSAQGFRIVDMAGATPETLAVELGNARHVVTMEGSHITHVYLLAPAGVNLCVLMQEDRTTFIHRPIAHAFGSRFGFLIGTKEGSRYRFKSEDIIRTVDLFDM